MTYVIMVALMKSTYTKGVMVMAKETSRVFQMRLTEEDAAMMDELTALYDVDRSNLVRYALAYISKTKPIFKVEIAPMGKEVASPLVMALN